MIFIRNLNTLVLRRERKDECFVENWSNYVCLHLQRVK